MGYAVCCVGYAVWANMRSCSVGQHEVMLTQGYAVWANMRSYSVGQHEVMATQGNIVRVSMKSWQHKVI